MASFHFSISNLNTNRMTNSKKECRELVSAAEPAQDVQPLAAVYPIKPIRKKQTRKKHTQSPIYVTIKVSHRKTPKKWTAPPSVIDIKDSDSKIPRKRLVKSVVIDIKDSDHKTAVKKANSPFPTSKNASPRKRKVSKKDDEEVCDVEKQTPQKKVKKIKIKFKKADVEKASSFHQRVSPRKRKRECKEDEEAKDVETPTRRVTRSAEGLGKNKKEKDGAKKVEKKIKKRQEEIEEEGEEEEEELEEEEETEEDEEEKEKKKRKKTKRKPKEKEVKFQYRSNLFTLAKLLKNIPNGEFTALQKQEIKKTPFAELVLGIVDAKLDESYVRKRDIDALKLVEQYEGSGGRFRLGSESVNITANELTLIFGIQSGSTRIELPTTTRVPDTAFAERLCPGLPGKRILFVPILKNFFEKAVKRKKLEDAKDVARVLTLLTIATLFSPNTAARVSWAWLGYIENLENSASYAWSTFIAEETISELNRKSSSPKAVGGCIMGLMYWLCEHARLIKQADPTNIPRFIKWRLGDLSKALHEKPLASLDPLLVNASELEPSDTEEKLFKIAKVPKRDADELAVEVEESDKKDTFGVETEDEHANSEDEDELEVFQERVRKLTEDGAEKDRTISELRRENVEKEETIFDLKKKISELERDTIPIYEFEAGIAVESEHQ